MGFFLEFLFDFQVKWAIDGKPGELTFCFLFVDKSFDTGEIGLFGVFEMDEELHVAEDIVVVVLMEFESILLPVKGIPLNSTDEAEAILIFFKGLFLLSHISELINNDSTNDFGDNELDNEQVNKVKDNISKLRINKSVDIRIGIGDDTSILFEAHIEWKHETKEQVGADIGVDCGAVVVINDRGEDVSGNDQHEKGDE